MTATHHAIILGAGASGLMCAATLAAGGKSVILVDHASAPGRKLRITGGGKGNITNRSVTVADFVGDDPLFCRSALAAFPPERMLDALATANIPVEEREEGQIFCRGSAKDVLRMLLDACKSCDFALGDPITAVEHPALTPNGSGKTGSGQPGLFTVRTRAGSWQAPALVVATGSPAWPQVGATDFGLCLARRFSLRVIPPRPALAGLRMPEAWPLAGLAGVACRASITLEDIPPRGAEDPAASPAKRKKCLSVSQSGVLAARNLPLLFTHSGISGPAALQASLYWRTNRALSIDFLPSHTLDAILDTRGAGKVLAGNLIKRLLPARLCEALISREIQQKKSAELSREQRNALARALHRHHVIPVGTEGLRKAEVAAGGVCTRELMQGSLQSKRIPNLFFCGEVVDITGRLGGYNLHWAFASGRLAGLGLIDSLESDDGTH